jgi:hypothetical protein
MITRLPAARITRIKEFMPAAWAQGQSLNGFYGMIENR